MKSLIALAVCLSIFLPSVYGACVINTTYAYGLREVDFTREVSCQDWFTAWTAEIDDGEVTIDTYVLRTDFITPYTGSLSIDTIAGDSVGSFESSAWSCPNNVNQGQTLTCTQALANGNLAVTLSTSLAIPSDGNTANQWKNRYSIGFVGNTADATVRLSAGTGCTVTDTAITCGYNCNAELVTYDFDSTWSGNGDSGNVQISAIGNSVLITLANSANNNPRLTFTSVVPKPVADDCNGGGGGGGSSASSLSFALFPAVLLALFALFY